MATIRLASSLRQHCAGAASVQVQAPDLTSALSQLAELFPECWQRIAGSDGRPREFVRIYVNDEAIPPGVDTEVKLVAGDDITIVPAVPGG